MLGDFLSKNHRRPDSFLALCRSFSIELASFLPKACSQVWTFTLTFFFLVLAPEVCVSANLLHRCLWPLPLSPPVSFTVNAPRLSDQQNFPPSVGFVERIFFAFYGRAHSLLWDSRHSPSFSHLCGRAMEAVFCLRRPPPAFLPCRHFIPLKFSFSTMVKGHLFHSTPLFFFPFERSLILLV